mmetsp:Transcript_6895/g.18097  ORF Transcript_6895/g.18097 Transcript_6895/m.18097 type:complete len:82 (+) Transcript_6895:167-412(+)
MDALNSNPVSQHVMYAKLLDNIPVLADIPEGIATLLREACTLAFAKGSWGHNKWRARSSCISKEPLMASNCTTFASRKSDS